MARTPERNTRQRHAIREVIASAGVPIPPTEILRQARGNVGGLGLATVYRTLKLLSDAGVVIAVEIPGKPPHYELAGKHHHHHFHCRACGKVFEVEGCCGHFAEHAPKGFELEGHEVLLFGRCAACAGGKKPAGAKPKKHTHTH